MLGRHLQTGGRERSRPSPSGLPLGTHLTSSQPRWVAFWVGSEPRLCETVTPRSQAKLVGRRLGATDSP